MTVRKFRKRPVEVEAMQFTGENGAEIAAFVGDEPREIEYLPGAYAIVTLEGTMVADPGDWIIKGIAGEFYPCKPDIFDATYEPVVPVEKQP